jgi:hypothetical protein
LRVPRMKRIYDPSAFGRRVLFFWKRVMSEAMKMIVDGYVRLKDREALEELRKHRRRLRQQLQEQRETAFGSFDVSKSLQAFDAEVLVIEAGLERLHASANG